VGTGSGAEARRTFGGNQSRVPGPGTTTEMERLVSRNIERAFTVSVIVESTDEGTTVVITHSAIGSGEDAVETPRRPLFAD
jgi:hypothetical protein